MLASKLATLEGSPAGRPTTSVFDGKDRSVGEVIGVDAVMQVDLSSRLLDSGSCFNGPFGLPSSVVVPAVPVTFSTAFTPPYTVR